MTKFNLILCVLALLSFSSCTTVQAPNYLMETGQVSVYPTMSFFVTSRGLGDGANLGGLERADAHCEELAFGVGHGGKGWSAYLSTTGAAGVNARDRIGDGPWFNAHGVLIATDLDQLHGDNNITGATAVTETGGIVHGRVTENGWRAFHDMLTGSQSDGTALNSEQDTTCNNWTSNSEGSALLGHHNRRGGGYDATSWVNAHASSGCSPESMASGAELFYCFASSVEVAPEATP